MANVVAYGEQIYIAYSASASYSNFQIDAIDELIPITPVEFDGQPSGDNLRALPDDCRIEMKQTGAYFFCISSNRYGTSAAKVGTPLYPFYVAGGNYTAWYGNKTENAQSGSTFNTYNYLYIYKQPDGRGYRIGRCGSQYIQRPETIWETNSYYTAANLTPGDCVSFKVASTPTTITCNGVDTELNEGQTATLKCANKKAVSDIVVAFGSAGTITYNGTQTSVESGKTATLQCNGKKMETDVVIAL